MLAACISPSDAQVERLCSIGDVSQCRGWLVIYLVRSVSSSPPEAGVVFVPLPSVSLCSLPLAEPSLA